MKNFALLLIVLLPLMAIAQPCTTTDASGCVCADGRDTCNLLPDITISWDAILNYMSGPTEYSQTGNGSNNGRLRITGSTPNIGFGSFTVRGTDYYVCDNDTIYDPTGNVTCPSGSAPTNLLHQRIYKKINGTMTYEDRWAGAQTYHPSHGHNHVDDWVVLTLRIEEPNNLDTLSWPIVGDGAKLGFCLMDFGTCDYYNGHCRDKQVYGGGNILSSSDFPNYGLGGGSYSCSPVQQGISVGYTDIYSENLDGMWVDIPSGTCNGDYWIVAQVDFRNNFVESNEDNNWTAVPFTLTNQVPSGSAVAEVTINGTPNICGDNEVILEANTSNTYMWSTGDTTQSITVTQGGNYLVQTTSQCGTATSDTIKIGEIPSDITMMKGDSTCNEGSLVLEADGPGIISWYDAPTGGNLLDTGSIFTTPMLQATTTYYVQNVTSLPGSVTFSEPENHAGSQFSGTQYNGSVMFDCLSAFALKSVKVYTDDAGSRTIELRTSGGTVLQDTTINIPSGTSRINLNFNVTPGTALELGTNENANQTNFGYASPALQRSSSGVNYPYVIDGVLSLNDSPYGSTYYYYFYDWEVEEGSTECSGNREAITAVILPAPVVDLFGIDTVYELSDGAVTMAGSPVGGSFTGSGVTNNVFDPSAAGIGTHTISYSYMSANGCSDMSSKVVVVVGDIAVANAGPDVELCTGEETTLTASGGVSYIWNTGQTSASIVVIPAQTTTYMVTVSNSTTQDDDTVTVYVNQLPVVSFSGLSTSYFDSDGPVSLTGQPSGGTFSGPAITNDSFYPATAGVGSHTITYSYTDQNSCTNESSKQVDVISAVVASAGDDVEICVGNQTTLTASGGNDYLWNTGETTASIDVSPFYTTTYSVTVSVSGNQDTDDVKVTVHQLPVVDFTGLNTSYDVTDAQVSLSGIPSGGTFSGPGVSGNTFSPSEAGVGGPYDVNYSYTDNNSCSNTETRSVTITDNSVGIQELNKFYIERIYPNPTENQITLEFSNVIKQSTEIKLYNTLGAELVDFNISKGSKFFQYDFSNYPKGIYYIKLTTSTKTISYKIIKE